MSPGADLHRRFSPRTVFRTPQVCSRGDLDPLHPSLEGCYDSKATSAALFFAWPDPERDNAAAAAALANVAGGSNGRAAAAGPEGGGDGPDASRPLPWPMGAWAINGPTAQGQTPFSWAGLAAPAPNATGLNGKASTVNSGGAAVRYTRAHTRAPTRT